MSERMALALVNIGGLALTAILILGLAAVGANGSEIFFGFLIPLYLSSVGVSRVTMHYGSSGRRKR
jgi:hypothetical protein